MDKIAVLTKFSAMAVAGPNCDLTNFTEFIHKNLQLYELANDGMKLSTHAQANFCRNELAKALRRGPYQVNTLIGGYDATSKDATTATVSGKSSLYYLDYLGCLHKLNYACQGYCNMFCAGIMDREYKASVDEMSFDDALNIINKCMKEIQTRFLVSQPNFIIKIIDKDGVRVHSFGQNPADN
jgi:20S proteasome subunit beta 4